MIRLSKAGGAIISVVALVCTPVWATSVSVVGLFKDKALVSIDGGKPRMLHAGQAVAGVKLLSADSASATLEVDGARRVLRMGQFFAGAPTDARQRVALAADARGHFAAPGSVNGFPTTFLVDTGATAVALSAADARRMGINYRAGQLVPVNTAAGQIPAWRVKLNTVKVGGIAVHQIDGLVVESGLATPLLGMSFLNRMEMKRDGQTMTLIQRY